MTRPLHDPLFSTDGPYTNPHTPTAYEHMAAHQPERVLIRDGGADHCEVEAIRALTAIRPLAFVCGPEVAARLAREGGIAEKDLTPVAPGAAPALEALHLAVFPAMPPLAGDTGEAPLAMTPCGWGSSRTRTSVLHTLIGEGLAETLADELNPAPALKPAPPPPAALGDCRRSAAPHMRARGMEADLEHVVGTPGAYALGGVAGARLSRRAAADQRGPAAGPGACPRPLGPAASPLTALPGHRSHPARAAT